MRLRYAAGRSAFARRELHWEQSDIVAYLVDDSYAAADRHRAVKDLYGVLAGPAPVPGRSEHDGYLRLAMVKFPRVRTEGKHAAGVVIAARDGALLVYSNEIDRFPTQANGGDIDIHFDGHLFRL